MGEHIRARTRGEITSRCSGPGGSRGPRDLRVRLASARPLNVGRSFLVLAVEVRDDDGRLVAQVTQTQAVLAG